MTSNSVYTRTPGPSEQRSLLLPPPRNGTGITGCRQCADLQRKFCKFCHFASFASFASVVSRQALSWHSSAKIRVSFRRFSRCAGDPFRKSPSAFDKMCPSKKNENRGWAENRGKPHYILWWTTWWPMDRRRSFSSSPIFGESFGRAADFHAKRDKPYKL